MWPPIIITTIILITTITTRVSLALNFIAPNPPAVSSNYVRLGSIKIEPPTTKTTIELGTAKTTPPPTMTTTVTTVSIDLDEFLDRQAYLSRVSRWGRATTAISAVDEKDYIDLLPAWTPGEPMVSAKEEEEDYDDYESSMPLNNGNQGPNGEGNVVGGEEDSETKDDENEATNEPIMTPKPTVTYYTETTMETASIYTPPPLTSWIYPPPASSISRAYNFMMDIKLLLVVDILVGCYFPMFQLRQV